MRRLYRRLAITVAFLCALPSSFAATQPNIVLIMTDDAGYNEMGFSAALTGHATQFETPNLDQLAQQSVVARQGYVAHSLCSPSRAGLLTGQYPHRFGFETNLATGPSFPFVDATGLTADQATIATHLKGLGYSTGMIGKWHNGYIQGVNTPMDKGFDEFFGLWSGARHYFDDFRQPNAIRRGNDMYESEYLAYLKADGQPCTNCLPPTDHDNNPNTPPRRYVTDAFGEEAAMFVENHADDANPFFLYMAPTAPHDPYEAKPDDYQRFAHITDPLKRAQAAMTYAMDRAVGRVISALDDPNDDGDPSDSVRDNTIIMFLNDNGGINGLNDNTPFRGGKGFTWEGSNRVPFFINMPGVQSGVYDHPISSLDILPTLYAAAGGDPENLETDGVDLQPHLSGSDASRPHETLFWRNISLWGVRKGDWKLESDGTMRLFNLAQDPGEMDNRLSAEPEIAEDLKREMTAWEATIDKPKFGVASISPYNHFVFRSQNFGFAFTNSVNVWTDSASATVTSLSPADVYANTILEFPVKFGNYIVSNNRATLSGLSFVLNEMQLTGNFTTAFNCLADFVGQPYVFTKDLAGNGPKLRLDAVSTGTAARFTYNINANLQLLDDLEITGNGTQNFLIHGGINHYLHPRHVTKSGTSKVTLTGNNTFAGNLYVNGGEVLLSGASAEISSANAIVIGSQGKFSQDSGVVAVNTIDTSAGGIYQFTGGELRTTNIVGDLSNHGGTYSPGSSPAASSISGDFLQSASPARLIMQISGTTPGSDYDQITVGGSAELGGVLRVRFLDQFLPTLGDVFDLILTGEGVFDTFDRLVLPGLPAGLEWRADYSSLKFSLVVDTSGSGSYIPFAGDYNLDGTVDSLDYVEWRRTLHSTTLLDADGDRDGKVDDDDFLVWRANFGKKLPPLTSASGSVVGIPEPSAIVLAMLALGAVEEWRRRTHLHSSGSRDRAA